MSVHKYNSDLSEKNAHYNYDDQKIQLTKFKSFLYNIPPGLHYYTLEKTDLLDSEVLLKIELYHDDKK